MKYYKDTADGVYGVEKPLVHVPAEWIEITKAEFDTLTAPSPAGIAAAAQASEDAQDRQDAKEDAKLQEIAALRPAQAKQWAKDNFPTLTNSEQRALGAIVTAIAVLGRTL